MHAKDLPLPQCQIPMPVAIEEMHICRNLFFLRNVRKRQDLAIDFNADLRVYNTLCQILNTWHYSFGM